MALSAVTTGISTIAGGVTSLANAFSGIKSAFGGSGGGQYETHASKRWRALYATQEAAKFEEQKKIVEWQKQEAEKQSLWNRLKEARLLGIQEAKQLGSLFLARMGLESEQTPTTVITRPQAAGIGVVGIGAIVFVAYLIFSKRRK